MKEQPIETVNEALTPEELRRQKRREYMSEYYPEYYRKNREKRSAQMREYYLRNRDRELAEAREYYQKNRERIRATQLERYHSDPVYKEKRLARWKKTREDYKRFKIEFGGKCSICGRMTLMLLTPIIQMEKRRRDVLLSIPKSLGTGLNVELNRKSFFSV